MLFAIRLKKIPFKIFIKGKEKQCITRMQKK